MQQTALQYIEKKEFEYKEATGSELALKTCPFCGDERYKFYINKETGLYDCKICAHQGNLYQLKAHFGDLEDFTSARSLVGKEYKPLDENISVEYEKELWKDANALEYLYSRGFTDDIIKHFRLGLEGDWITIPHFADKKLWNVKFRNYRQKEFRRISGQPTALYNIDNVDITKETLVVVEGEMDCIATKQLGINNVVGLTGGAKGFKAEWNSFFNKFKRIYICLDTDAVGQSGAERLAEKIGFLRTYNVLLPEGIKDVNEYLQTGRYTKEDFYALFGTATRFNIKSITSLDEYVRKIDEWFEEDGTMKGIDIDYPKLNGILGGLKGEDLIILSGDSGVGKTTFALNLMHQFAKNDVKCLAFCLEGKVPYYILRMMSIESGLPLEKLREDEIEWEVLKDAFSEYPIHFYSGSQADMDTKKMKELLPAAVQMLGIEFVMIDNLQKYVRGTNDVFLRTGEAVSVLKDLAVDLKIPVMLISHITKRNSNSPGRISMHDAKSSSTIYQDADVFLIIQTDRKKEKYMVSIEKNRMGEGGIDIDFDFDKKTARYHELSAAEIKEKRPKVVKENV